MKTPQSFAQAEGQSVAADTSDPAKWWRTFHDRTLSSLVRRVIDGNLDVQVTKARLREARAAFKNTEAAKRLPSGDLELTYGHIRTSTDNSQIPAAGH